MTCSLLLFCRAYVCVCVCSFTWNIQVARRHYTRCRRCVIVIKFFFTMALRDFILFVGGFSRSRALYLRFVFHARACPVKNFCQCALQKCLHVTYVSSDNIDNRALCFFSNWTHDNKDYRYLCFC